MHQRCLGRDAELAVATDVVAAVRAGRGATVLVEGASGLGKTTLLDDATARADGIDVRRAAARVHDTVRPLAPLAAVLGLSVPPPLTGRRSPLQATSTETFRLVELAVSAARRAAEDGGLVLVVDDLQWADAVTVAAIAALVPLTAEVPLGLLLARRPVPESRELADLVAALGGVGAGLVALPPLDDDAVAELATRMTGAPPGPSLRRRLGVASGNPFLVEQVVHQARDAGLLDEVGGTLEVRPGAALPAPDLVLARMADLGEAPVRLLRVLALLDGQATYTELAAATGEQVATMLDDLARCRSAGVVLDTPYGVEMTHALVREAIEASLPSAAVSSIRREVGHRLLAAGADPVRVAAQFLRSGDGPDIGASRLLVDVATALAAPSPGAAADLFARARDLAGISAPDRAVALAGLVDACFWAGRLHDVLALGDEVRGESDPVLRLRADEAVVRALTVLGQPAAALDRARAMPRPAGHRAWSEAVTATMAMLALELGEADERAESALATADDEPDTSAEVLARCVRSWVANLRGFHHAAAEEAARAVGLADASREMTGHRMVPRLFHGLALESAASSEEARATLRRGRELADELGTSWAVPFFHYAEALGHWNAGRWEESAAECDAGLRFARGHGVGLAAPWAHAVRAATSLVQGDVDTAGEHLDHGERLIADGGVQFGLDWLVWIRALHLEARGDREAAVRLLTDAWTVAEAVQASSALTLFGPDLVRMAVLSDQRDTAVEVVGAMATSPTAGRDNIDAHVARCRGLVERDLVAVARARAAHAAGSRPVDVVLDDEAEALVLLAGARSAAGRQQAAEALQRASEGAERLGMDLVRDRLHRAGLEAGVAAGAGPPAPRPRTGWDSLTPTELRVAALVSSGRTNADVAAELGTSVRSVESHLYRVFAKLGVRNRTELALARSARPD